MKIRSLVHPDVPAARPLLLLWNVLDKMNQSHIKYYWIGYGFKGDHGAGRRSSFVEGWYMAALIFPRGAKLAFDFTLKNGNFGKGNMRRAARCAQLGIDVLFLGQSDSMPEMEMKIRLTIQHLEEK